MARVHLIMIMTTLLLVAGCSTKVKLADEDPAFADAMMSAQELALGGVMAAPDLGVFDPVDQADADDALFGAFLRQGGDLEVWPRGRVADQLSEEVLAGLVGQYTATGRFNYLEVQKLEPSLAPCRYLAFARLTEDVISSDTNTGELRDQEARAAGVPEHGDTWNSMVTTTRKIKVTLEIFDLTTGFSVWSAEARTSDRQSYDYEAPAAGADMIQERLADTSDDQVIQRHGGALRGADLIGLMAKAFGELVQRLPVAPGA